MYQLTLKITRAQSNLADMILEDMADALSSFEDGADWRCDAFYQQKPDVDAIKAALKAAGIKHISFKFEKIKPTDWLKKNQESFAPIIAGRFFVHPSHVKKFPASKIPLLIDAATAFGTGHHATTYGCLLAANDIFKYRKPKNALDMGCGTAILAMGAAKVTKRKTLAVDIDKESVRVSKINIHVNRLSPLIQAAAGDGYKSHLVKSRGKYDFVFANILAKPLTRMAKDLRGLLAPGGIVILSGLLKNQEKMVLAAHRLHGMRFIRRYTRDGWHSLVLQG